MKRSLLATAVLILAFANGTTAQNALVAPPQPAVPAAASVPFGVGERMTYKVHLGVLGDVGTGSLQIVDLDTINGHPSYELRFTVKGGVPFARVDDDYRSWLDVRTLFSRRFKQDQNEVHYERHRTLDFFPEEKLWKRTDPGSTETGALTTDSPLDDVSFLYIIRTLPLEVGKTYTFNRYWKDDSNPVIAKVLRKQTIIVGANKFRTIVVQPIIKTKGLFSEGGKAEVYFSDDDRRILVAIKSKVKILKSLDMTLEKYEPGQRLVP